MKHSRVLALSGVGLLAIAAIPSGYTSKSIEAVSETERIDVHLDRAVRFLNRYTPSGLNSDELAKRDTAIRTVNAYRDTAVYPHGHHAEGLELFFVDEHGTPCALADLIQRTGRSDIVNAVRDRMNGAWVHEIVADPQLGPELMSWLDENGLTVADAATIQVPGYTGQGPRAQVSPFYGAATAASVGTSTVSSTVSMLSFGSTGATSAWLGIISGAASLTLGAVEMNAGGNRRTLAEVNLVSGVAALALGTVRLLTIPDAPRVVSENKTVAPNIQVDRHGRSMFGLRLSF